MKAVYVNKEAFLCKNCVCESKCSGGAGMLKKEIECLTREKSLLEKYVSELEFSNGLLKSQLSCNINKSSSAANSSTIAPPAKTYAEQVKSVKMSSVLVVRSSDQNIANTDLEREMKAKVRPGSLNANVLETNLIKNGIIINCENSASLHKLKDGLQREMGNTRKCSVYEQKKINSKNIVYSVDKLAAQSDKLIEYIIKDNTLDAQPSDIKLVTKLNYEKSVNLILEVKPTLFKIIMNIGYLYVGWMRCSIREHFNTTFCFKCCKFGHYKKNCKSQNVVCPICSGSHERRDCNSDSPCCINCKDMNAKNRTNFPVDHSSISPTCPCYLNRIGYLRSRTDYEQ
nr:unnamed protein product [Callosobruchus chinensis]